MLRDTSRVLNPALALQYMTVPASLAAAITELGLTAEQVLTQTQTHFALSDSAYLVEVAKAIYPDGGGSAFGVLWQSAGDVQGAAAGAQGGAPSITLLQADWLRLLNLTGLNGDAITLTRVDPAIIFTKTW